MRICLITPLPPPMGGISLWTSKMLPALQEVDGVEVRHIDISPKTRKPGKGSLLARVSGGIVLTIRKSFELMHVLRTKVDIVHITTSGKLAACRDLFFLVLCRFCSTPVVYQIRHGRIPELSLGHSPEWLLMRLNFKIATAVFVLDGKTQQALSRLGLEAKLRQIPNFFDPADINSVDIHSLTSAECKSVVFIGRLSSAKGALELIEAWKRIDRPEWQLVFVGEFDASISREVREGAGNRNISFLGELSHADALTCLGRSGIFCLPSHSEGFPNSVIEAMAMGRPVVATRVGAMEEIATPDVGALVDAGDIAGLIAALQTLLDDETLRLKLGAEARLKAWRLYARGVVVKRYLQEWQALSR